MLYWGSSVGINARIIYRLLTSYGFIVQHTGKDFVSLCQQHRSWCGASEWDKGCCSGTAPKLIFCLQTTNELTELYPVMPLPFSVCLNLKTSCIPKLFTPWKSLHHTTVNKLIVVLRRLTYTSQLVCCKTTSLGGQRSSFYYRRKLIAWII